MLQANAVELMRINIPSGGSQVWPLGTGSPYIYMYVRVIILADFNFIVMKADHQTTKINYSSLPNSGCTVILPNFLAFQNNYYK